MQILDELASEHILIERVLGALRTYVAWRARGEAPRDDAARFLAFFRIYAGAFHHEREESVLFPALIGQAELPADRGPIAAITAQHRAMAATLDRLAPLLLGALASDEERAEALALAASYTGALARHIDAEDSVLLPESEKRLRRVAAGELPVRAPTAEEEAVRRDGEALVAAYPPSEDPAVVRGEGCVVCPSFGVDCDGVEREWWNESEWEEFPDHL